MSFVRREPSAFISIKLTNTGRHLLAKGQLRFNRAVLSDREIDYSIDLEHGYSLGCNRVLFPQNDYPSLPYANFDGSTPLNILDGVFSETKTVTASTSMGFFEPTTEEGVTPLSYEYKLKNDLMLGSGVTNFYLLVNNYDVTAFGSGASIGDMVVLRTPYSTDANVAGTDVRWPIPWLWYQIRERDPNFVDASSIDFVFDRSVTNLLTVDPLQNTTMFQYPIIGPEASLYSPNADTHNPIMNLSIVRPTSEIGAALDREYLNYGSLNYNGLIQHLGLSDRRSVGFVHYSNIGTGNTLGEIFVPRTTKLVMPTLMWHNKGVDNGTSVYQGHTFTDSASHISFDASLNTRYTVLRDGDSTGSTEVGRVYNDLQVIAITDPELLTAMSYKANRNWTLPPMNASVKAVQDISFSGTGLCTTGKTYYVTYILEVSPNTYADGVSSGLNRYLHCGYVQRVEGQVDENGNDTFLRLDFGGRGFPYMRSNSDFFTSGTGWVSNTMRVLIAEVDNSDDRGLIGVDSYDWKRYFFNNQVGQYDSQTEEGENHITPSLLANKVFILNREDFESTTQEYDLSTYMPEVLYRNALSGNVQLDSLVFGDETFFFGNVETTIGAVVHTTKILIKINENEFNASINPTFDGTRNSETYISEIGIFDDQQRLVGVAKPTYPIRKDQTRHLTFELEYDF